MMEFSSDVKITGFDKPKKVELNNKLRRALRRSMFKMQELAIEFAPTDQGFLSARIDVFPQILSDRFTLISRAPYSAAIEFGTRPFYAPIKPLKEWAGRVLGDADAGYAVQAKIAKFGITASPFMRPALYQVDNFWLPLFIKEELNK